MSLEYEVESRLRALAPILDEHAEWFGRVMRHVFYPEASGEDDLQDISKGFKEWASDSGAEFIDPEQLGRLESLHDELHKAAEKLLEASGKSGDKPDVKLMDAFVDLYDDFVMHIRRIEKDCFLADSGLDELTGLRSKQVMKKDLNREMERRARRGKPFVIILARMDLRDEILLSEGEEYFITKIKEAAEAVKKCIRSYDDAYRLDNAEFLLSLKHSDMAGGLSAVSRLRNILDEMMLEIEIDGTKKPMSLSYCLGEPMPGDDITELLAQLSNDLDENKDELDAIVQYHEVSPLQRYIEEIDE